MNPSQELTQQLEQVFKSATRAVVGLVSDLLNSCPDGGLELTWHAELCHIRMLSAKSRAAIEIPLQRFVMRTVIARVAALCSEDQPNFVSPYGGEGVFSWVERPFQTTFSNTPGEQKLVLIPIN